MKIELHCHTLYGSCCGLADADTIVKRYLDAGHDGVVITNHYHENSFAEYPGNTKKEKLDFYFSLFDKVKETGEKQGLKVFLGTEIHVNRQNDFLLYGFDRSLLYDNKPMFDLTQKEIFDLAEKKGLFFAQAHPCRRGVHSLGEPTLMHGVERFNGHFHHYNNNERAEEFCLKNNLIGFSGTDFHTPDQPITTGLITPNRIENESQLVECLFSRKFELYCDKVKYESSRDKFYNGEWN